MFAAIAVLDLVFGFQMENCINTIINVPPWWPGSSSKIITVNSYVRHNFI